MLLSIGGVNQTKYMFSKSKATLGLVKRISNSRRTRARSLMFSVSSSGGRNRFGRITVRGRGVRSWRQGCRLNWLRRLRDEVAEVVAVVSDPSRTARAVLGFYRRLGLFEYSLAAEGLGSGALYATVFSPYSFVFTSVARLSRRGVGLCYPLQVLSVGTHLFGLEMVPSQGGVLVRAAGTSARILQKIKVGAQMFVAVRLRSGMSKYLHGSCLGVLGQVSNVRHRACVLGTAGVRRRLGFRSKVRGVAMNPVDHPHGGGEGKTSGGRPSVSPWGWLTKGKKTTSFKLQKRRIHWLKKVRHGHGL